MNRLTRCQRLLSCSASQIGRVILESASFPCPLPSFPRQLRSLNQKQSRIRLAPNLGAFSEARDPGVSRHRRDSESEGKQEGGGWEKLPSADTAHNKEVLRLAYQQA
jgi:hypothetical protein